MGRKICTFFLMSGFLASGGAFAQSVQGYGHDVSLQNAVSDIVPYGYKVNYGSGVDKSAHVDWKGGSSWDAVLQDAVRPLGLSVVLQKKSHNVRLVAQSETVVAHEVAPVPVASSAPAVLPKIASVEPISAPSLRSQLHVAPAGDTGVWRATAGQTVTQVLQGWASRSGWTVSLKTKEDYEIEASADFDGDFVSAATAFLKSIHVEPRLKAVFHTGNNVLVVGTSFSQTQ